LWGFDPVSWLRKENKMKHLIEKEIKRKMLYKGHLINLREDVVKTAAGKESRREIVEHPGAVAIIAITNDDEIILIQQFRKAAEQVLIEIPAGVPDKGEKEEEAARRELEEETGYHAKKVKKIWEGYVTPGYSDECLKYYLAQDMIETKQRLDGDEAIDVMLVDIEAAVDLVKTGKIIDNKTAIGIWLASMEINEKSN